jgi:Restriction endonuclease NotI
MSFQNLRDGTSKSCSKKGGVCLLRLYDSQDDGAATCSTGDAGKLVTVCPLRFNQESIVFDWVGQVILATSRPHVLGEVRFLRRIKVEPEQDESEQEQGKAVRKEREDVGNIDNVLVHPTLSPIHWCVLEIQSVYFSGEKMPALFSHIAHWEESAIPFPDRTRRPDFRSSGPKRLMPQLQIKVPTLRRWGKKMAVVVDEQFFNKLGEMDEIPHPSDISNCDIIWFVMGFDENQDQNAAGLYTSDNP